MKNLIIFLLVVSTGCLVHRTQCVGLDNVLDIIEVAKTVVVAISKSWNIVDEHVDFGEIPIPLLDRTEHKLFGKIGVINAKVDAIAQQIDMTATSTIDTVFRTLSERVRLELRLNDLIDYITRMDVMYNRFQHYVNKQNDFERITLEDFAKTAVSHDSNSVNNLIERIHTFIVSNDRKLTNNGLLELLQITLELPPHELIKDLEVSPPTKEKIQSVLGGLRKIFALYQTFKRFEKLQTTPGRIPSPQQAWIDIAKTFLYDKNNKIEDAMENVEVISRLYQDVKKEVKGDMLCNYKLSPHQVLYNLYRTIALTELKGYMMIQFSYMLLRLYNAGNFTTEAQIMRDRFEERTNKVIEVVRGAMSKASRELWNCDPKKHEKNQTYIEVTQLLQGFVQNEVDLNPEGTCRENCAEYAYTRSHGCFKNLFCREQRRCSGKILNCQFYDSDMWICPADPDSGRRYEYIEYENGRVLGRKQGCHRGTTKVDSWWRWLFWHCSYCFCFCDEQGSSSDRYFNMRPTITDRNNNKVVTGLRFVKVNRIIHMQVQEGKLAPRGNIENGTVRWMPVDNYKITDRKVYNGQDYHTLTSEKRAIDLDTLEVDDGHVVTGVRFKMIGSHLNFEVFQSQFDFDTGKLIRPDINSRWKDNHNTDVSENPRTKLTLIHPDIPTRTISPSVPDSKSDQFIEFTHSDVERDVAQTTVPFLDSQDVAPQEPVPLAGAGLYHKGRHNFGGFIAPKIITYNFTKHLKAAFPKEEIN